MSTNLRPRVFTEDQVREMLQPIWDSFLWDQSGLDSLLDEHTTSLNYMIYPILGALEEAGEIAGKAKKVIRDDNGHITPDHEDAIAYEVGDLLWYQAAIADALKLNMEEIAEENLDKLADRARRGVLGGSGDSR